MTSQISFNLHVLKYEYLENKTRCQEIELCLYNYQFLVGCSHLSICSQDNPETAADLVTSLDNFGFDLEEDFDRNDDIMENEVQKNLAFEMRRVNLGNRQGREDVIFRQNKSRIVLPRAIFTQVYIAYDNSCLGFARYSDYVVYNICV